MEKRNFRSEFQHFKFRLAKFFSLWLFIIGAITVVIVAALDHFTAIPAFKEKTSLAIAVLLAGTFSYVVVERAKVLDEILALIKTSRVQIYPTSETAYIEAAKLMAQISVSGQGNKQISLAALHGHSGKRKPAPAKPNPAFDLFDSEMQKCINSSGANMWNVRVLFNVTDLDRLNMILTHLEKTKDADGFEVRAFCFLSAIPHLTPLIIGDEDLLIGWDDPNYYRTRGAIHLRGHDCVRAGIEYFDSLWNDERTFKIRRAAGIDDAEVERLKGCLSV